MFTFLTVILNIIQSYIALVMGYLLFLTCAALFASRQTKFGNSDKLHTFSILIPAHNEEKLLPELLENLQTIDYPKNNYAIHVVADNCTDATAEIARRTGANVYERFDTENLGKGFALEWLISQLEAVGSIGDAILILDSDSIVSNNFLRVMNERLGRGEQIIQAYYAVRNPEGSWSASLRAVALAALHYLRPLARNVLGASTGLKGNGMVFATDIIRKYHWSASLTEDIEYHMKLILDGHRATFAPNAVVWAEMPNSLASSHSQNARWERGRQEMLRQYVPRLLILAVKRKKFLLLDAAIEQLIPPFSIVAATSIASLIGALLLQDRFSIWLGFTLVALLFVYTFAGVFLARLPLRVYRSLLYAPVFIIWKFWLYVRVLFGSGKGIWVRTARNNS